MTPGLFRMQRTRVVPDHSEFHREFSVEQKQPLVLRARFLLLHGTPGPQIHTQYAHTPQHHTHARRKLLICRLSGYTEEVSPSSDKMGFSTERAWARDSQAGPGRQELEPRPVTLELFSCLYNAAGLTSSPYLTPSRCGLWPVDTSTSLVCQPQAHTLPLSAAK